VQVWDENGEGRVRVGRSFGPVWGRARSSRVWDGSGQIFNLRRTLMYCALNQEINEEIQNLLNALQLLEDILI